MYTPNDYRLDQEYRQHQMNRAVHQQQVDEAQDTQQGMHPNLQVNLMSIASILISVIVLVMFFVYSAQPAKAQDALGVSAGDSGDGNDMSEFLYLQTAINKVLVEDYEAAIRFLHFAIGEEPDFLPAYITLSFVAVQQGDYDEAQEQGAIALALNAEDAAVHFVLAEAHFAQGNCDAVQGHYDTYTALIVEKGSEPLLITILLNDESSIPIISDHVASCATEKNS